MGGSIFSFKALHGPVLFAITLQLCLVSRQIARTVKEIRKTAKYSKTRN